MVPNVAKVTAPDEMSGDIRRCGGEPVAHCMYIFVVDVWATGRAP